MKLPTLYLSIPSQHRVIDTGTRAMFIDEKSGELCSTAMACDNPSCPGRKGEEPFLFPLHSSGYFVRSDGKIGYDPARTSKASQKTDGCPECAKIRNPTRETPEEQQQYMRWVHPYVLPETAKRLKELDEEDKRREDSFNERRGRKMQQLPDRG